MKEAIITIVVPATDNEPMHTVVWRVEFEGEVTDTLVQGFNISGVVSSEKLTAK